MLCIWHSFTHSSVGCIVVHQVTIYFGSWVQHIAGDLYTAPLKASEVERTLTMRLRNLEAALVNSSHHLRVDFEVVGSAEKCLVKKHMGLGPYTRCNELMCVRTVSGTMSGLLYVFTAENHELQCRP